MHCVGDHVYVCMQYTKMASNIKVQLLLIVILSALMLQITYRIDYQEVTNRHTACCLTRIKSTYQLHHLQSQSWAQGSLWHSVEASSPAWLMQDHHTPEDAYKNINIENENVVVQCSVPGKYSLPGVHPSMYHISRDQCKNSFRSMQLYTIYNPGKCPAATN